MDLTIEEALKRGVEAHRSGDVQRAGELYKIILNAQPLHPDANHNTGILAIGAGQLEEALRYFELAIDANPNVEQFWLSYLDTLLNLDRFTQAGNTLTKARERGFKEGVLDEFQQRINQLAADGRASLNVDPPEIRVQSLIGLHSKGNFKEAVDQVTQLLSQFPNSTLLHNIQGASYAGLAQFDLAAASCRNVLRINPEDAESHNNLGLALRSLGEIDSSIESYRQALRFYEGYADAFYNMGNALSHKGDFLAAIDSFSEALKINPDSADTFNNLGVAQKNNGDIELAIDSYSQALQLAPDHSDACYNLGDALVEKRDIDGAINSFQRAIDIKPDHSRAHNNMGIALMERGDFDAAIASYSIALTINPDFYEAHNNAGLSFRQMGMLDEAIDSYQKALNIKSDYADAHNNIGNVYKDIGKTVDAVDHYRQAIEREPTGVDAYHNMGVILQATGQHEKALNFFDEAISLSGRGSAALAKYQALQLKSIYAFNDKDRFSACLTTISASHQTNALLGSLCSRAKIKYGIEVENHFCNNPLAYVMQTSLFSICDFERVFVEPARQALGDLSVSRRHQTLLVNGYQTAGNVLAGGSDLFKNAREIIELQIEKYRNTFSESCEGLLTSWPRDYYLDGWLVGYKNGGAIKPHIHEVGWLSGSVYINVPSSLEFNSGNLVVGLNDGQDKGTFQTNSTSVIDVDTGSFCLFPASLHHHTIPFQSSEERIVLAFDMVAVP